MAINARVGTAALGRPTGREPSGLDAITDFQAKIKSSFARWTAEGGCPYMKLQFFDGDRIICIDAHFARNLHGFFGDLAGC